MSQEEGLMIYKKLELIGIAQIFDYAWHKYHPAGHFAAIVLYAVHTYSWETKMVRIGADWQKTKIRIAQKVNLPQYLYDDVVNLADQYLANTFQEFLNLYNDNIDYVHLTSIKELYQQIMAEATRYQPAEKAETADLSLKFKNLQRASELKEQIKTLEDELVAKYRLLAGAKSDFKYDHIEHGNPLQLENSKMIRG
jgi:hypothetical protein